MKEENKEMFVRVLFTLAIFGGSLSILKLILGVTEGFGLRFWIADALAALIGVTFWFKFKSERKKEGGKR
jgi:hypothetical protein